MRGKSMLALTSLVLLTLLVGCGGGAKEDTAAEQGSALWNEAQAMKKELDAKRAELRQLTDQLKALQATPDSSETPPSDAADESTESTDVGEALTPEQLQAKIADLRAEITSQTDALYGKIVEYLNSAGMVEGVELTTEQRQAFNLKAEIDILIAQEYIDRGGDYKRAIDIYSQALMSDPGNEKLLAAKTTAEELRFMGEERFAKVTKGMTEDEVAELLGTVKPSNKRDFAEKGRIGWFYPKDGGGAAGVYFKEKKKGDGEWLVEVTDFAAVPAPNAGGKNEEDESDD